MEIIKIHPTLDGKMGTEFARDFCAGIGLLQLGVVLVYHYYLFMIVYGNVDESTQWA